MGTKLVRRVHQREADIVIAQDVRVVPLIAPRKQVENRPTAQLQPRHRLDRSDAPQLHGEPKAPFSTARLRASTPSSNMFRAACGSGRA